MASDKIVSVKLSVYSWHILLSLLTEMSRIAGYQGPTKEMYEMLQAQLNDTKD